MGKIQVGIAAAIGVLVGILIAPRKGSETREQIALRAKAPLQQAAAPLQQAARKATSTAGDAIRPIARAVGERVPKIDRVPLLGRDRKGPEVEDSAGEAGDESPAAVGEGSDGESPGRRAR